MTNQPDIVIVEACKVKAGDMIILNTNESLSQEVVYSIRGRLEEEFKDLGVKFFIVAGARLIHIPKEENYAHLDTHNA